MPVSQSLSGSARASGEELTQELGEELTQELGEELTQEWGEELGEELGEGFPQRPRGCHFSIRGVVVISRQTKSEVRCQKLDVRGEESESEEEGRTRAEGRI